MRFRDRADAGRRLGERLSAWAGLPSVLVLALPRGGVPVAFEVAERLFAPLDVFLVRKLAVPSHEERAMGAIASGGVRVLDGDVVRAMNLPEATVARVEARELAELARRERAYRGDRPPPRVACRTVILVDDGLSSAATLRAAVIALRRLGPARVIVAVPIASPETCAELRFEADEVVCATAPQSLLAKGAGYEDLSPVSEQAVRELLDRAERGHSLVA